MLHEHKQKRAGAKLRINSAFFVCCSACANPMVDLGDFKLPKPPYFMRRHLALAYPVKYGFAAYPEIVSNNAH